MKNQHFSRKCNVSVYGSSDSQDAVDVLGMCSKILRKTGLKSAGLEAAQCRILLTEKNAPVSTSMVAGWNGPSWRAW